MSAFGDSGGGGDFRVEGYEIEGLLGAGPTGELWLARHRSSGSLVGLKRLRPKDVDAHDEARRIVAVLGMLNHPSLLRIRELLPYGEDELVLVMDHAEGGTLDQLLFARTSLDPGEVVTVAATVAHALAAAHEHGLVHGDVTPESIVFTADGQPLVTDMGLSSLVERWDVLGTHGYADPAQPPTPTKESDIYGLAAVCYTALAGQPLDPGHQRRPLHQVAPGVPSGLSHAIEAGLQSHPSTRPNATSFANQIDASAPRSAVRFPDAPEAGGFTGFPAPSSPVEENPFAIGGAGGGAQEPGPAPSQSPSQPATPAQPQQQQPTSNPFAPTTGAPSPFPTSQAPVSVDPDADDDEDRPRRKIVLPWKALAIGVPAAVVLVIGIIVGAKLFAGDGGTPTPTSSATQTEGSNSKIVAIPRPATKPKLSGQDAAKFAKIWDELDVRRERAFQTLDRQALNTVYLPASPPWDGDLNLMADIKSRGFTGVQGLWTPLESLKTTSVGDKQVIAEAITINPEKWQAIMPGGTAIPQRDRNAGKHWIRKVTFVPAQDGNGWVISSDVKRAAP